MSQQSIRLENLTTNSGSRSKISKTASLPDRAKNFAEETSMKVYEVECGAVITITAQDMQKAALHGAAAIKDNPHLIYVRAVHERNLEPAREDLSAKTIRPRLERPIEAQNINSSQLGSPTYLHQGRRRTLEKKRSSSST
jgi:hypothetical protein